MDDLISESGAAYLLMSTPNKLRRWVKTAGLRAVVLPDGDYLFDRADLEQFVQAHKQGVKVEHIKT